MPQTTSDNTIAIVAALRDILRAHESGATSASAVVAAFREKTPGLALPEAFPRVLDELLRRLEMAAVFSQDSCSFSSTGIQEQLTMWLDKAEARLSVA